MAIRVMTATPQDFIEASGWHVDDNGYLHIINAAAKGNLATFRPEAWSSVERFDVHPDVLKQAKRVVELHDKLAAK